MCESTQFLFSTFLVTAIGIRHAASRHREVGAELHQLARVGHGIARYLAEHAGVAVAAVHRGSDGARRKAVSDPGHAANSGLRECGLVLHDGVVEGVGGKRRGHEDQGGAGTLERLGYGRKDNGERWAKAVMATAPEAPGGPGADVQGEGFAVLESGAGLPRQTKTNEAAKDTGVHTPIGAANRRNEEAMPVWAACRLLVTSMAGAAQPQAPEPLLGRVPGTDPMVTVAE